MKITGEKVVKVQIKKSSEILQQIINENPNNPIQLFNILKP